MRKSHLLLTAPLLAAALMGASDAAATPALADYRYFRALSLDLQGRVPTRAEVAAFEQDGFDLDGWIDAHTQGPAFAIRLRQIYMDLMRLEIGSSFQFVPSATTLRSQVINGPDGQPVKVFFRDGQRRLRDETDGTFCFTQAESGLQYPHNAAATGTPKNVTQAALDAATVVVKPWWLYADYKAASPSQLYGSGWEAKAGFQLIPDLVTAADGSAITSIRICKEEAQTGDTGSIYVTGRKAPDKGAAPPYGRLYPLPLDSSYATKHPGDAISCTGGTAFPLAADCGCGQGLERCMPTDTSSFSSSAFVFPATAPLGFDQPFDSVSQDHAAWARAWWGQEARHLFEDVFANDRDFRDLLSARDTFVNGPLTQFYTSIAPASCCGNGEYFGLVAPEPLFDPKSLPKLLPTDTTTWQHVVDRGPHAAGLLTMPVFLTKYGSRRARAHVMYQAFLCRDFVAENLQLAPSTDPNLMERPGCSACHAKLEPLAAYFSRIMESDWTYLPPDKFPVDNPTCAMSKTGTILGQCTNYYDPAFTDASSAKLRGAYASADNVEAGPAGIAAAFTSAPEFPGCVAQNVTSAFLGRPLTSEDAALTQSLAATFVDGGYRMRALVTALVKSDAYHRANDLSSTTWRAQ